MHLTRSLAIALGLMVAAASGPALAQSKHEIKGKVVSVEAASKHLVVEETHGRKYRQPLTVGDAAKIELANGPGTLAQVHVGDEVDVSYEGSATGPQVVELHVTKAAGS